MSISTALSAFAVATGAEGEDDDEIADCCFCCGGGRRSSPGAYAKVGQSEDGDAEAGGVTARSASYQNVSDANSGVASGGSVQVAPSDENSGHGAGSSGQRRPIHLLAPGNRGQGRFALLQGVSRIPLLGGVI